MAVTKLLVNEFIDKASHTPVIDVRSPAEFLHAHIPGAFSLPLFTDEERKIIGTAYKQDSREEAIKHGLGYFGPKMVKIVEEVERIAGRNESGVGSQEAGVTRREKGGGRREAGVISQESPVRSQQSGGKADVGSRLKTSDSVLIHCWRGGMRSAAVAWLLDLYGYKIYTLDGGYKAFRQWVSQQFEKDYPLNVIGGYTGSGKTEILTELKKKGEMVIDLEALANHKGSAFGGIRHGAQPSTEMFENKLAVELTRAQAVDSCKMTDDRAKADERYIMAEDTVNQPPTTNPVQTPARKKSAGEVHPGGHHTSTQTYDLSTVNYQLSSPKQLPTIWIEDESQRIGNINIPNAFWKTMRCKPVLFLDIPFEERLENIFRSYGKDDKEKLINAVIRIKKRLGGLETNAAINFLLEDNLKECFRILLNYYDKWYKKGLQSRDKWMDLLTEIKTGKVDPQLNTALILSHKREEQNV